ncbi:hypothetical protein Cme02nite_28870 [Catellatospora methionotrophica]|uniref:Aminoglycoside phosphotransferase domain-containing protein n=1 Tax=Catellatospora methionotrophica TaxID=121620 RepID=A0A8J3L972_9ACTN|nr:aminoglycoside phosphotransferase family protein [Catellatospora methionotrophica]GIG14555.1 hypothetical protein Cme02nite_28870 [Catellatospora methionotrophica]
MADLLAATLHQWGAFARHPVDRLESRSGAGVHAVLTADGAEAYVKLTPADRGPHALAAARRELRFYRELAPAVAVGTPGLLAHADTGDAVALLLAAAGVAREPRSWTAAGWAGLGRDLARLHRTPAPDWQRPDDLRDAMAAADLSAVEAFWRPTLPRLAELVDRRDELRRQAAALPPAFIHGDCHTGNITLVGDRRHLLDWQVCGTGRPAADLAFLNVRAAPGGVSAPPDLLDGYLAEQPHDPAVTRLAVLAEELSVYVFQWPPFAAYNTAAGVEHVRRRARALHDRWFDGTAA